jgi:uncharacterized membrane protein
MAEQITRTIIVKATPEHAYQVWENFENFPMFMKWIKSVQKTGNGASHWEMQGPLGKTIDWDAETTRKDPNKRIGWSTKDRSGDLTTSGQVTFNGLPQGETEITVLMQYVPKAGAVGDLVAKILGDPEKKLEEDLSNFKSYIEGAPAKKTG